MQTQAANGNGNVKDAYHYALGRIQLEISSRSISSHFSDKQLIAKERQREEARTKEITKGKA